MKILEVSAKTGAGMEATEALFESLLVPV
jgi:hypothetical protein